MKKLKLIIFIMISAIFFSVLSSATSSASSTTDIYNNKSNLTIKTNLYNSFNISDASFPILVNIEITVDKNTTKHIVPIDSLENTLAHLDIDLGENDTINAELSSRIFKNQKIIIQRVSFSESFEEQTINYKIKEIKSDDMLLGETKIIENGKKGIEKIEYKDTYFDGKLTYHNRVNSIVKLEPKDKIIQVGTKNILVLQNNYLSNSKNQVLLKTIHDQENFKLPQVKITDKDRDLLEKLITGEFGSSYIGACLIAQSVKCAIVYDNYQSIESLIKGMGYVGSTNIGKSQNAINAVKFIFDENGLAVKHRLFYMCTEDYYNSNPNNFHSTQNYILQYENVKFFDRWN